MNRLNRRGPGRHLSPRLPVTVGAALGLVAGLAIYGGMTSLTVATKPVAFTVAKTARAARAPVSESPAWFAKCAAGQKLERGVCVIHIVRKVVIAPAAASVAPASVPPARAPVTGAVAKSTPNPAGGARPGTAARPGSAAKPGSAPEEPDNPAVADS